jgi:hypothetical protein
MGKTWCPSQSLNCELFLEAIVAPYVKIGTRSYSNAGNEFTSPDRVTSRFNFRTRLFPPDNDAEGIMFDALTDRMEAELPGMSNSVKERYRRYKWSY